MKPLSRCRWFWALLALGGVIRLVYFFWSQELPFFNNPITDALFHHRWAMAIADGLIWDGKPFFRAPLYPYVLAALYRVFGPHIWIGKLFGHTIGLISGGLTIALADRLFGRREAVVAALLWLGSGLLIFYEGELLLDSFFLFLTVVGLYFLLTGPPSRRRLVVAGIGFGLAAITRPTILIVLPVLVYWLWRRSKQGAVRDFLSLGIPMAVPILLVAGLNSYALGHPAGIATQGGINFYIGNNSAANGISATLPPPWGYAWRYGDLVRHAEQVEGRSLDATEVSDFYFAQGREFIFAHPGAFLALALKKAVMSVNRLTISNNLNLPYVLRELPILRWLPVRVAWLLPLALAGWVRLRRPGMLYRSLWVYVALYTLVLVLFFMIERFRLPLVPVWIVLAAFGVGSLWERDRRRRWLALILVAVGILLAFPNWYGVREENQALAYFNLANVALREGHNQQAMRLYDSSLALNDRLHQLRLNRGIAQLRLNHLADAEADFRTEAELFPADARPFNNLAALYMLRGDTVHAEQLIDSGLQRDSGLAILYLQRLAIARERGDTATMDATLQAALRNTENLPVWNYWHGEEDLSAGRLGDARAAFRRFKAERERWPTLDGDDVGVAGPEPARVDYQIALAYLGDGDLSGAADYFGRAATADSTFAEAWFNWGTAALSQRDFATAIARYRIALRSDPESAVGWTNLARAYAAAGNLDEARVAVVKALAADSTFAPARELAQQLQKLQ